MPRTCYLLALLAVAAALTGCTEDSRERRELSQTTTAALPVANAAPPHSPKPATADCSTRSFGDFIGAFTNPANLVVGPFVLVGGATPTSAATVEELGGQKYPVLVREGHVVTVEIPDAARGFVSLGYGPLPQGKVGFHDGHEAVAFTACARGTDAASRTFWSGFVFALEPSCVPLDVYLDGLPSPRRVEIALGRAC
jgi:hypothetical protein